MVIERQYLLQSRPQKAPNQKLKSLQLRLNNNQLEIRLRVHIPRLIFDKLNLPPTLVPFFNPTFPPSCPIKSLLVTYLPSHPLQHPIHRLPRPLQNLRRHALRNPTPCQFLQVACFPRRAVDRDFGEQVIDIHYCGGGMCNGGESWAEVELSGSKFEFGHVRDMGIEGRRGAGQGCGGFRDDRRS